MNNIIINIYYAHHIYGLGIQMCFRQFCLGVSHEVTVTMSVRAAVPGGSFSKMAHSQGWQVGAIPGGGLTFSPYGLLNVITTRPLTFPRVTDP